MRYFFIFTFIFSLNAWCIPHCDDGWRLPGQAEIDKTFGRYSFSVNSSCRERNDCARGLINSYVAGDFSQYLNFMLRTYSEDSDLDIKKMASLIEQSLCIAPLYKGIVYRGIDVFLKYREGELITLNSFLSTSKNRSLAESFGTKTFYIIRSLKGRDISKISPLDHEEEVLFSMGSFFIVRYISSDNVVMMDEI